MNKLKRIIFILIPLAICSCTTNNQIEKEYDKNNNLKLIKFYGDDDIIDSTHFYTDKKIDEKLYNKNDSISYLVNIGKKGKTLSEGKIANKKSDLKLGKWKFYKKKGVERVVEYVKLNNKSNINQIWEINKKTRDTIQDKGVYLKTYFKDTIKVNDTLRMRFYLYQPLMSYNSDILLVLSEDEKEIYNDFSKIFNEDRDTLESLKNDGIPHPEIPKEVPKNHNINFGITFKETGNKILKGYVAEYISVGNKDTISNRDEFRIFFQKKIYVKDSIN